MTAATFNLQGHRGARGLVPENTLPAFETALDLGVSSIETDIHLTRDSVPVLAHDPIVSARIFRLLPDSASPDPARRPLLRHLTLAELRGYVADRNPDPSRFPGQRTVLTPMAEWYARQHHLHCYSPPTLTDLFSLWQAYVSSAAGPTDHARRVVFDLELKRVPFHAETDGELERRVLEVVAQPAS